MFSPDERAHDRRGRGVIQRCERELSDGDRRRGHREDQGERGEPLEDEPRGDEDFGDDAVEHAPR